MSGITIIIIHSFHHPIAGQSLSPTVTVPSMSIYVQRVLPASIRNKAIHQRLLVYDGNVGMYNK